MKCICLAHGKAEKILRRNAATWQPAFDEIIYITPTDDHMPGSIALGLSCVRGKGEGFMTRMRYALNLLSEEKVGAVMDYDIVMPPIRMPDEAVGDREILCSQVLYDDYWGKYQSTIYGHSPTIATGETWKRILAQDGFGGDDSEYSDRWMALCAKRASVTFRAVPAGFSKDGAWSNQTREMARQSGAVVFHGVKTDADFIAVTHTPAYRAACARASKV